MDWAAGLFFASIDKNWLFNLTVLLKKVTGKKFTVLKVRSGNLLVIQLKKDLLKKILQIVM